MLSKNDRAFLIVKDSDQLHKEENREYSRVDTCMDLDDDSNEIDEG